MRRNISNGSSSSGSRTNKKHLCAKKTEILTEGNSFAMTRIVTHNGHTNSDASDVDEVCPNDQLYMLSYI